MAYLIMNKDSNAAGPCSVYANDEELNSANFCRDSHDVITITDEEMNAICIGTKWPKKVDGSLTYEEIAEADLGVVTDDTSDISGISKWFDHSKALKDAYRNFIDNNPEHSRKAEVQAALDAIPTYEEIKSSLPLNKPLWKSLNDAGYTGVICPLRLP